MADAKTQCEHLADTMDKEKLYQDLKNSVIILEANISLFHSGTKEVYIVIANELRKLICDKSNSLLPKVFSNIQLFPITLPPQKEEGDETSQTYGPAIVQTFGAMKFNGKGDYKIVDLFDQTKRKIELINWLQQTLLISHGIITIEQLIKSISDKEGVHADNHYNQTILQVKFLRVGVKGNGNAKDTRAYYITAIGEYILSEIKKYVDSNFEKFSKYFSAPFQSENTL